MNEADFWWEIMKSEGLGFASSMFGGTIVGAGIGLIGVGLVYLLFRMLGLLPKSGGGAKKIVTLAWLLMALPVGFGFVGFHNGLVKGAHRFVTEGKFSDEVMPQVSVGISDFVFQLDNAMAGVLQESIDTNRVE